jgi:hypothetical protein
MVESIKSLSDVLRQRLAEKPSTRPKELSELGSLAEVFVEVLLTSAGIFDERGVTNDKLVREIWDRADALERRSDPG